MAALLTLGSLAYVLARETSVFALRALEIRGASASVAGDVRTVLDELEGKSLVEVDAGAVERRLRELPSVAAASVDRAFPHTLRVDVEPERPLAVLVDGSTAWVVSRQGQVIGAAPPRTRLARLRVESGALTVGTRVADEDARALLSALAHVPADFPVRVRQARGGTAGVTLIVGRHVELRLGTGDDLAVKLASAAAVLDSLPRRERRGLAYLDVGLPQRPVSLSKSQVEGES